MKLVATRKADQGQAPIDPWTLVHIGMGLATGLMNMPAAPTLVAAVAYEVVEHQAQRESWAKTLFQTSGPESLSNAVVDVIVFALAHQAGRAYNRR